MSYLLNKVAGRINGDRITYSAIIEPIVIAIMTKVFPLLVSKPDSAYFDAEVVGP
ncbi:hypothetical protein GCM10007978_17320 [Shewanella hanedai]|nr:hypothetical protein GCM10007978_17320 [Shewanella hanedai]